MLITNAASIERDCDLERRRARTAREDDIALSNVSSSASGIART
jgi:hypothetical protein